MPGVSDVRLRLAQAVAAGHRGFLVQPDNSAGSRGEVAALVASGQAFAVTPRPDLLVLDADPQGLDPAAAARQRVAFDCLVAAAQAAGVGVVVVASGRPGHRHAFITGAGGDLAGRRALSVACRRAGLDVRDAGIRPPLTPHRLGFDVALISPATGEEAAEILEDRSASTQLMPALCRALGAPVLSLRIRRLLRDGHTAAGLPSASEGRMALAVAVAGAGLPASYLSAVLEEPDHELGRSFRDRPGRWRRREIDRLWSKATRWAAEHPTVAEVGETRRRAAASWFCALGTVAWPGVGAASALAVAEYLGRLGVQVARCEVAASLDDVAVGAGLSRDAARRALRRLVSLGWLGVAAEQTPVHARVWALQLPADVPAAAVAAAAARADEDLLAGSGLADLGADACRWSGGLGKSSARVARALQTGDLSVAELAGAVHMSVNAVRIHLRRLSGLAVVARAGDRWQLLVCGPDPVQQLAGRLGTAGSRVAQQAAVLALRAARRAAQLGRLRAAEHRTGLGSSRPGRWPHRSVGRQAVSPADRLARCPAVLPASPG